MSSQDVWVDFIKENRETITGILKGSTGCNAVVDFIEENREMIMRMLRILKEPTSSWLEKFGRSTLSTRVFQLA